MRLSNFWYLVKQGFKNIYQNRMMSFSCIGVLVACMLLIGSSVLFTITVNNLVDEVDSQSEIVVYLEEGASVKQTDEKFAEIGNILEIEFMSKKERLEQEKIRYGDNADLLDGLEGKENPLPDTYVLRVEDTDKMAETVAQIRQIKGVEKVHAPEEVARVLAGIKRTVYYAGVGIVGILIIVSLAIITNTIKITVFSRRREINIMKYVGATDTFIRLPFLVEGLVIGFTAAIIAFFTIGIGYPYLINWAYNNYGQALSIIFNNAASFDAVAGKLFAGFASIGGVIGILSSTVFIRKHLRV